MSQSTPSIPQGTRDFGPEIMVRRNYIFDTIRQAFQLFGYPPLETPAMEKTETLTGKYGDEGDKLIFRILDSGDYLQIADNKSLDYINTLQQILFYNISEAYTSYTSAPISIEDNYDQAKNQFLQSLQTAFSQSTYDISPISSFSIHERAELRESLKGCLNAELQNSLWELIAHNNPKPSIEKIFYAWFNEALSRRSDYSKDLKRLFYKDLNSFSKKISEKALRYDLTVPFARYVVMNHNKLTYPFKRSQIQTVWRADRPQKGRYREFYQCDADVVGSDSLLYEVELVQLFDHVLTQLQIPSVIKINNRKILAGIADIAGIGDRMMEMTITIDKLDKIGVDGVMKELRDRGMSEDAISILQPFFDLQGSTKDKLTQLRTILQSSEVGMKGLDELQTVFDHVDRLGLRSAEIELDVTLARGLNYYTGAIFEVKVKGMQFGSICGGGRYDDLTGIFGLPGVSGVGISFGADRLYDVMLDMGLFDQVQVQNTQVLVANFGGAEEQAAMEAVQALRHAGIRTEMYPDASKMKKQFKYADDKSIAHVLIIGEEERQQGKVQLKNMSTGAQSICTLEEAITQL